MRTMLKIGNFPPFRYPFCIIEIILIPSKAKIALHIDTKNRIDLDQMTKIGQ